MSDIVVTRHPFVRNKLLVKRLVRWEGERMVLEGDNPSESTDSRSLGPIPATDLLGVVESIWKPPSK